MGKKQRLFIDAHPRILSFPGHEVSVEEHGWDSPPLWSTSCSCGWQGRTFVSFAEGWKYPLPIQIFIDEFGHESLLNSNELYGELEDAQREVLAHLPTLVDNRLRDARRAVQRLANSSEELTKALAKELTGQAKNIEWLLAANELLELPLKAPRNFSQVVYDGYQELCKRFSDPMLELNEKQVIEFVELVRKRAGKQ